MSSLSDFLAEPRNVIVAGVRRDGRPHLSPNWFYWDGERFFISTTRDRVKFKIFSRDPRVELIIDDATGHRYTRVSGTVEILTDVHGNLPMNRALQGARRRGARGVADRRQPHPARGDSGQAADRVVRDGCRGLKSPGR